MCDRAGKDRGRWFFWFVTTSVRRVQRSYFVFVLIILSIDCHEWFGSYRDTMGSMAPDWVFVLFVIAHPSPRCPFFLTHEPTPSPYLVRFKVIADLDRKFVSMLF